MIIKRPYIVRFKSDGLTLTHEVAATNEDAAIEQVKNKFVVDSIIDVKRKSDVTKDE